MRRDASPRLRHDGFGGQERRRLPRASRGGTTVQGREPRAAETLRHGGDWEPSDSRLPRLD